MSTNLKVESGLQLLSRIIKRPGIENFYPILFETGPKQGDIIELFSDISTSGLLLDMICEMLLPVKLGGVEASILILSTDGHLKTENIFEYFRKKLMAGIKSNTTKEIEQFFNNIDDIYNNSLKKILFMEIFDSTQLYITIQNIENVLAKHSNISVVIIDTLTAFYWSEQNLKIMKMDLNLKMLLKSIHKVTKDFKVTILYTRPEYFCSTKEVMTNLEPCSELQSSEQLNYRIQIKHIGDVTYDVIVRTYNKQINRQFILCDGFITWFEIK